MSMNPTPSTAAPRKAKWTGIIWSIAILVVTAVVGIVMIVLSISTIADTIDGLEQVDAGETREVRLDSGDQYVFAGARSSRDLDDVDVEVRDPSGSVVPLRRGNSYDAANDDEQFESIGYIDVGTAGTYTITVDGPPGSTVRIGEIPIARIIGLLLGGIAVGGLGFVVALVIFIVALVRRSRVKKANRAAAWSGSQPPGPYGSPPAPGYGGPPAAPGYGGPSAPGYGAPPSTPGAPGGGPPPPPAGTPTPPPPPPSGWPPPSGPSGPPPPPGSAT